MSRRLIAFRLSRAGWGNSQSLDLNVRQIETACDPETLPNLLRVKANAPLAAVLSWPGLSGCALQCLYEIGPVDRGGPGTLTHLYQDCRSFCGFRRFSGSGIPATY